MHLPESEISCATVSPNKNVTPSAPPPSTEVDRKKTALSEMFIFPPLLWKVLVCFSNVFLYSQKSKKKQVGKTPRILNFGSNKQKPSVCRTVQPHRYLPVLFLPNSSLGVGHCFCSCSRYLPPKQTKRVIPVEKLARRILRGWPASSQQRGADAQDGIAGRNADPRLQACSFPPLPRYCTGQSFSINFCTLTQKYTAWLQQILLSAPSSTSTLFFSSDQTTGKLLTLFILALPMLQGTERHNEKNPLLLLSKRVLIGLLPTTCLARGNTSNLQSQRFLKWLSWHLCRGLWKPYSSQAIY